MLVRVLGKKDTAAYKLAAETVINCGCILFDDSMYYVDQSVKIDLNIAPLLTEKIPNDVINDARCGTLIFHPSPLPYGRGASSIRWAYKRVEPVTAATWFWADDGLDTGNICEQEVVKILYEMKPKQFYESEILPAMKRTLKRCLNSLSIGLKREIPQVSKYASYDKKL